MPNGIFYRHFADRSFSNVRGIWLLFNNTMFIEIPVFDANSVDPDKTPHSAASDLGPHCFANILFMGR